MFAYNFILLQYRLHVISYRLWQQFFKYYIFSVITVADLGGGSSSRKPVFSDHFE